MAAPQSTGNTLATWEEVFQSEINSYLKGRNIIFQTVKNTDNERVCGATQLNSTALPFLIFVAMDHKESDDDWKPSGRPVCGASWAINELCSKYMVDILDTLASSSTIHEINSKEKLLSYIIAMVSEQNKQDPGDLSLGSWDIGALYNSIHIQKAAKMSKERVLRSDMTFENIN